MNTRHAKLKLHYIIHNEPNSIKAFVAQELLSKKNYQAFFEALFIKGCACGVVSSLKHYDQTHYFFDKYYDQIETLRLEREPPEFDLLDLNYDLKSAYAWFAFEQVASDLAFELGIYAAQ
ncbi:hypothetical protein [Kordia sp. SMS9]|uniref:DUF7222 domain-containing protein n=1 Tax=Kordia sp. SMS9 TaxID=2282170 RepID=UPI0013B444C8|nr:hypothetical protein [Kordia sp. SMS9]